MFLFNCPKCGKPPKYTKVKAGEHRVKCTGKAASSPSVTRETAQEAQAAWNQFVMGESRVKPV